MRQRGIEYQTICSSTPSFARHTNLSLPASSCTHFQIPQTPFPFSIHWINHFLTLIFQTKIQNLTQTETYLSLQTFFSGAISSTGLNVLSEDLRGVFFDNDSRRRASGRSCGTRRTGPLSPTVLRAIRILDLNRGGGAQILRLDLHVESLHPRWRRRGELWWRC